MIYILPAIFTAGVATTGTEFGYLDASSAICSISSHNYHDVYFFYIPMVIFNLVGLIAGMTKAHCLVEKERCGRRAKWVTLWERNSKGERDKCWVTDWDLATYKVTWRHNNIFLIFCRCRVSQYVSAYFYTFHFVSLGIPVIATIAVAIGKSSFTGENSWRRFHMLRTPLFFLLMFIALW